MKYGFLLKVFGAKNKAMILGLESIETTGKTICEIEIMLQQNHETNFFPNVAGIPLFFAEKGNYAHFE